MQTRHELYEIKSALRKEISEALNETYMSAEIEIFEINVNDTYSIKGSFKVTPFLSQTVKRKGKFETTMNENLKLSLIHI